MHSESNQNVLTVISQMGRFSRDILTPLIVFSISLTVFGAEVPTLDTIEVTDSRVNMSGSADSASQGTVLRQQLEARPIYRPAELLEAAPGLIVTQHSGEGKANQYFLRGINLDHGTHLPATADR